MEYSTIEIVGWIGTMMLALCAVPEVIRSITYKRCTIGWGTLILWWLGEWFTIVYVIFRAPEIPLIINYGLNLILINILVYYKWRYRND